MNKRLRKKKRVGEFTEWGLPVVGRVVSQQAADPFLDSFIEFVESKSMFCAGGFSSSGVFDFFVELGRGKTSSKDSIGQLREWFVSRPEVESFTFGSPIDLWHGRYEMLGSLP